MQRVADVPCPPQSRQPRDDPVSRYVCIVQLALRRPRTMLQNITEYMRPISHFTANRECSAERIRDWNLNVLLFVESNVLRGLSQSLYEWGRGSHKEYPSGTLIDVRVAR